MLWIKWYPTDWLHSTCRDDLSAAERATFQDYVCLASLRTPVGQFKVSSWDAIARQLNTPLSIILSTNEKCIAQKRIEIIGPNDIGELIVVVFNWPYYQSFGPVNKKTKKHRKTFTKSRIDKIREDKNRGEKTKTSKGGEEPDTEDVRLVQLLIDRMKENNPNSSTLRRLTPTRKARWHRQFRLLLEADKRTPEEIERVIRFSQADSFWKGNILSMPKLREKWDQLWMKATSRNGSNEPRASMIGRAPEGQKGFSPEYLSERLRLSKLNLPEDEFRKRLASFVAKMKGGEDG